MPFNRHKNGKTQHWFGFKLKKYNQTSDISHTTNVYKCLTGGGK